MRLATAISTRPCVHAARVGVAEQRQVHPGRTSVVARAFDPDPAHPVTGQQVDQLDEAGRAVEYLPRATTRATHWTPSTSSSSRVVVDEGADTFLARSGGD